MLALLALTLAAAAPPAADFKVVAAPALVADSAADPRFEGGALLDEFLAREIQRAWPARAIQLGADHAIDAGAMVVLVQPRITAVRTTHEVVAGDIHVFEAIVVGDVSAVDIWTDTVLFSGSRMVSSRVAVGRSVLGAADTYVRSAFQDAAPRWAAAVVEELAGVLSPFVLEEQTLEPPRALKRGGIWPVGAERGVRAGQVAASPSGRRIRLTTVLDGYSLVEDTADPGRRIPGNESFALQFVRRPTDRPEPRVAIHWIGVAPFAPARTAAPFSRAGLVTLFSSALAEKGGLRFLAVERDEATAEMQHRIAAELSRHTTLTKVDALTVHRETLARSASDSPEQVVEIGQLDAYHGMRIVDGITEHYVRVVFAAAIRSALPCAQGVALPVTGYREHVEELTARELDGVRDIDPADLLLSASRNAVIKLAQQVRSDLDQRVPGRGAVAFVGEAGAIEWKDGAPPDGTPLEWLRPCGTSGTLGLYCRVTPSLGYLTPGLLRSESMRRGDVLLYPDSGSGLRGTVARLELQVDAVQGDAAPPPAEWLARQIAARLAKSLPVAFVPDDGHAGLPGGPLAALRVSMTSKRLGERAISRWICELRPAGTPPSERGERFGFEGDASLTPATALDPPDLSRNAARFAAASIEELAGHAVRRQLATKLAQD